MAISLKDVKRIDELTVSEIEPIVANVKYAQRNDEEVTTVAEAA